MQKPKPLRILWEKIDEKNARVLRVFGTESVVRLPDKIEGRTVTEIGAYCFAQTSHLPEEYEEIFLYEEPDFTAEQTVPEAVSEQIFLPDESVEKSALTTFHLTELAGKYLTEVILPDSLEKIGNLAFYNCISLEKIELGNRMEQVGSDAFMNCRNFHQLVLRCRVAEKSGLRQILHQVTSDMEVTFQKDGNTEVVVFYPEYYESLDEVAPAHLFHRNIEGEGFRARQCFKEGVVDFTQYDMIFPKACVEENAETLQKIVCARLRYPVGMTEEARKLYETYVVEYEKEIVTGLVKRKELETIRDFCEKKYFAVSTMEQGVRTASEMEWAEGTATLLHWKQEFFGKTTKERYSFDDF